ncbi:outer membrane protein transport protein [Vibrio sp. IRLE0018]|uniref:outer membrane protein transport protein n=1 Tax=Vibrio floridensis TaxID=2908007 RepID=UPI001F25E887|nr:outer membrane protein transport protein [Vibrio floridensis]MCF8779599.1 outer membrane protein transport protein [Vibrio floridensis]
MTQNMRLFKKSLLAVTVALASGQTMAAGFQLNAQSATGLGRAFAGDAVIADNASVMARNPAAMALFDDMEMSLGFVSITSKIKVKDAQYAQNNLLLGQGAPLGTSYTSASNYGDAGDTSIAPNIHLIVPVNEQFAWGVNAYTNFGTKTEFDDSFVGTEYGGLTDVKSMNLGLAGSYRVNEQLSFGLGLDLIYGKGKLERSMRVYHPANGSVLQTQTALDADADGWALGFNLGTVYELDEDNRFGFSYRYSPDLEADGKVNYVGSGKGEIDDTLIMPLPDMAEFSGYHRLNEQFAVHYSVQWIGWAEFDKLEAKKSGVLNEYQWQDGMHYSIGGTYFMNQDWTLRAGYMYDTSAQDQITSVSVPDSDRQWLSAGFTYHIDQKSNIDFGFTYLMGEDVKVSESTDLTPTGLPANTIGTTFTGTTHADAILVGLQYSRSF